MGIARVHAPPNTMVFPKVGGVGLVFVLVLEEKTKMLCRKNVVDLTTDRMYRVKGAQTPSAVTCHWS